MGSGKLLSSSTGLFLCSVKRRRGVHCWLTPKTPREASMALWDGGGGNASVPASCQVFRTVLPSGTLTTAAWNMSKRCQPTNPAWPKPAGTIHFILPQHLEGPIRPPCHSQTGLPRPGCSSLQRRYATYCPVGALNMCLPAVRAGMAGGHCL
jgi:hypothetical protein